MSLRACQCNSDQELGLGSREWSREGKATGGCAAKCILLEQGAGSDGDQGEEIC